MDTKLLEEAQLLKEEAEQAQITLGFAESCTAGLCSATLASVPGASIVLAGGIVSYMLSVKEHVLGVSPEILYDKKLGPVSEECAVEMAQGARSVLGCDIAVSVTGYAGPDGGEPGKPAGTVWIGRASSTESIAKLFHFEGSRDEVRTQATACALHLAREGIMKENILA